MKPGQLVWFRRDLRSHDHAALAAALAQAQGGPVHCAFVFDPVLLDPLPRDDRRISFIHGALVDLDQRLRARGGGLRVLYGDPRTEIPRLAAHLQVATVRANRDYEPVAIARDEAVAAACRGAGAEFASHRDLVVREHPELRTRGGTPYTVFTPYKRAWLAALREADLAPQPSEAGELHAPVQAPLPALHEIGFAPADLAALGIEVGTHGGQRRLDAFLARLDRYRATRDFPALAGTSQLAAHLRFGTLSGRELMRAAVAQGALAGEAGAECWLGELIWREFFQMILVAFPHVATHCFQRHFDALLWDEAPDVLQAWQQGRTGYPLVDAGMRELRATGFMHNRLRMVTAAFLCKDLGLDWRLGEAWFARQLLDFDLAANNGGWQWSASTGCDAQPWFRIFNPVTQSEKFDPAGDYIRRWVPELATLSGKQIHAPWRLSEVEQRACGVVVGGDYPAPLVDHAAARERTLARYRAVSAKGGTGCGE